MTDCLILGFNDPDFAQYVDMVRSMGEDTGAFRDLRLAYVDVEGAPRRSMDLLNRYRFEDRPAPPRPLHNADFLWPTILYLGTYLTRHGFSFDYVNLPHLERDVLTEKLAEEDPLTVAITTTLYVSPHPIVELVELVRERNPRARIVVGGPYVANQARMEDRESLQKLFKYLGADVYVINQEGEAALVALLGALKSGGSLDTVENIAYRDGGSFTFTPSSLESNSLTENQVDYSLFPAGDVGQFVSLRTAKSCPFSCAFCGFPQRAGKYTYLDLDHVEAELDALAELGTVTTLTFLDDTFNVPKRRFKEILRLMIRKGYGFHWNSFYRCDHGDPEAIGLMAEAGCEGVFLGVESGSDMMLGHMNKSARRKNYLEAIPLLRQAGISTHANFIVGFPGETLETVEETVSLIEEARPDFYRAQLWYCDPVTPIWQRREEFGVQGSAFNWSHDTMDHATASRLVEDLFLGIEGSEWLPQHGFEQWSTFYLQRHGMTLDAIKRFVHSFNEALKEQLLIPGRRTVRPELLDRIRRSAQGDRSGLPAGVPEGESGTTVDLSGAAYRRAEAYFREWRAEPPPPLLPGDRSSAPEDAAGRRAVALPAGPRPDGGPAPEEALLAALAVAASAAVGGGEVAILCEDAEVPGEVYPVRLRPRPDEPFAALAERARRRRREAREHQSWTLWFLGEWIGPEAGGGGFDLGLRFGPPAEPGSPPAVPSRLDELAVVLSADAAHGAAEVRWTGGGAVREAAGDVLSLFLTALREGAADPGAAPSVLLAGERAVDTALAVDAREAFHF